MKKSINVATGAQQRIVEDDCILRCILEAYCLSFEVQVRFSQLLHKLAVWQAFAKNGMIPAILGVAVIDATKMDGDISIIQHPTFIDSQPHAVNDLQCLLYHALVAVAAVQQVLAGGVFQVLHALIHSKGKDLSPRKTKPCA